MRSKGLPAAFRGVVALALYNRKLEASGVAKNRLGGETRYFRWGGGELAYAVAGEGPPLILAHSVYAGASSFEFRKNFGALSEHFTVYAVDLLGCGMSEKPRRRYTPEDVADQIESFAGEVVGGSAHLIASSLTAALVMPALVRNPRLFGKVVFICPTGYRTLDASSGRLGDAVYGLFRTPVMGDALYHALVSRRSIRYYLEKTAYHDPALVTDALVEEYYRAGHGRGAKFLPAAFASGKLNFDVSGWWPRVANRTMIFWGREAKTAPLDLLNTFLSRNPRAAYRIFRDTALLPHDERPEAFNREVIEFLTGGG